MSTRVIGASGRRSRRVSPPPGDSSAMSTPSMASTKPRATVSPRPTPPPLAVVGALERLEHALALVLGHAGAVVDDLRASRSRAGGGADLDRPPSAPWRSALSSRLASTRSSSPGRRGPSGRSSGTSTGDLLCGAGHGRAPRRRPPRRARPARAGRSARRPPAGWRRAGWRRSRRAGRRSPRSSASSSLALLGGPVDVGLAQGADRGLDRRRAGCAGRGRRRRAARCAGGRPWRASRASRASLAQAPALVGGLGRGGERLQHALVLGEQRRAAADQAQVVARSGRRSAAAPPRRAAPSPRARRRPTRRDGRSRGLSATDSMWNVLAGALQDAVQRLRAPRGRRPRARTASRPPPRPARRPRARRAATSTAPLTIAATMTKTASASACSPCATSSVWTGGRRSS